MSYPIAVIVGIFWVRRVVSLVTKNYAICFRINWKTCITIHAIVMNAVHKIRLTKYAHRVGKLLFCSETYKVNMSCHCLVSLLLDWAALYCAACFGIAGLLCQRDYTRLPPFERFIWNTSPYAGVAYAIVRHKRYAASVLSESRLHLIRCMISASAV